MKVVIILLYGQTIHDGCSLALCTSPTQPVPALFTWLASSFSYRVSFVPDTWWARLTSNLPRMVACFSPTPQRLLLRLPTVSCAARVVLQEPLGEILLCSKPLISLLLQPGSFFSFKAGPKRFYKPAGVAQLFILVSVIFWGCFINVIDYSQSVQSHNHVWLFATLWTAVCLASLSITNSQSLLKFMSI